MSVKGAGGVYSIVSRRTAGWVENQAIIYPHVLKRLNGKQDMVKASKLVITISQ